MCVCVCDTLKKFFITAIYSNGGIYIDIVYHVFGTRENEMVNNVVIKYQLFHKFI